MADINWGILQPAQGAGIQTSMGSAPGAPAPQANPGIATAGQIQDMAAKQQQLGLLQKESARADALQPGLLTAQADAHAKAASEQAAAAYAVKVRQQTSQAFMEGSAKGGTQGGLDAAQRKMMELGDIEGALTQAKTVEELNKLKTEGNTAGIAALGNAVAGVVAGAKPAQVDPKTGQPVPGSAVTSLQLYAQQYPTLKKLYPNAPEPSSFKDDGQFHDAFTVPVLATAGPIAKQRQMDMEALKDDALHKAQIEVTNSTDALKTAIRDHGPTSQEAKDAAEALQNAQDAAKKTAVGKNWITDTVAAPFKATKEALGLGGSRTSETIKNYSATPETTKATEYNQVDLEHTAKIHGLTVEEVKAKLGAK